MFSRRKLFKFLGAGAATAAAAPAVAAAPVEIVPGMKVTGPGIPLDTTIIGHAHPVSDPCHAHSMVNYPRVYLSPAEVRMATNGTLVWSDGIGKGSPIGVVEYARRKA